MGFNFDKSGQNNSGSELEGQLAGNTINSSVSIVNNQVIGGDYKGLYAVQYVGSSYSEYAVYVQDNESYQFTTTQWYAQTSWSTGHPYYFSVSGMVYIDGATNTTTEITLKAVASGTFGGYDDTVSPSLPVTAKTNFTISADQGRDNSANIATGPKYTFSTYNYFIPGYSGSVHADLYAYTTQGGTLPDMTFDAFGNCYIGARALVYTFSSLGSAYIV